MAEGSVLAKVRKQMMAVGASEHELNAESGAAESMFKDLQALRHEMNEAKKAALIEIAAPYEEQIAALERRYALTIKLSAK